MNFGGMQPQIVLLREGTDVSQGARGWSLSFCTAAELCVSRPSRQGAVDKQHQRVLRCGRRCAHDTRPPRHGQAHLRRQGHHHQQRRRNHHEGARRATLAMRRAKERPSARGQLLRPADTRTQLLEISHPAAKTMVDIAKSQDSEASALRAAAPARLTSLLSARLATAPQPSCCWPASSCAKPSRSWRRGCTRSSSSRPSARRAPSRWTR